MSEFRILMSPGAHPFDDDGIAGFTSVSKAATQNGNNILVCKYNCHSIPSDRRSQRATSHRSNWESTTRKGIEHARWFNKPQKCRGISSWSLTLWETLSLSLLLYVKSSLALMNSKINDGDCTPLQKLFEFLGGGGNEAGSWKKFQHQTKGEAQKYRGDFILIILLDHSYRSVRADVEEGITDRSHWSTVSTRGDHPEFECQMAMETT